MSKEKNSESVMIRLTPTLMKRLHKAAIQTGLKPSVIARLALIEKVDQMNAKAPAVSKEVATAAAELRTLGLDPVIVLRDHIAEIERDNALNSPEAA